MPRDQNLISPLASVHSTLEHRVAQRGDAPYLISARDERIHTYAELLARVTKWRRVLRSASIHEGARCGIVIADPLDFAAALLAVLCDGSWVVPLDPTIDPEHVEAFACRTAQLHLDVVLCDHAAPHSVIPLVGVPEFLVSAPPHEPLIAPSRAGGIVLASSGTTGSPKIIALREDQLLFAAINIAHHNRLSSDDRGFNPLPLWHVNAEVVGLLATLVAGAALVLDDRFHRTDFWPSMDRFEVTWINAVPAIISRIAQLNDGESVPTRLRFVRSASAPLAPALLTSFERNTGVAIVESYGMTEAASQICVNPLDGPRKIGSVGPPVGVELRIAPYEDAGILSDLANAVLGQVEIRGPSVITHYDTSGYEDRFDDEGWLKTGDLGFIDDDGYLYLVGRSDDVINRGGEKILPREVEDVALGSPHVVAAAVVGQSNDVYGQVPILYVQFVPLDPGTNLDEVVRDLVGRLDVGLTPNQRPERLVVVESFPTHATGKILKKSLDAAALTVVLDRVLA